MKKTCYKSHGEVEAAKTDAEKFEFVYIRELSRLELGRRADLKPVNWNEVIEVRFFDDKGELRFFDNGDGLKAAEIIIDPDDDCKDTDYELEHDGEFGGGITVRECFDYDDDGQLYVAASRLVDWRA